MNDQLKLATTSAIKVLIFNALATPLRQGISQYTKIFGTKSPPLIEKQASFMIGVKCETPLLSAKRKR